MMLDITMSTISAENKKMMNAINDLFQIYFQDDIKGQVMFITFIVAIIGTIILFISYFKKSNTDSNRQKQTAKTAKTIKPTKITNITSKATINTTTNNEIKAANIDQKETKDELSTSSNSYSAISDAIKQPQQPLTNPTGTKMDNPPSQPPIPQIPQIPDNIDFAPSLTGSASNYRSCTGSTTEGSPFMPFTEKSSPFQPIIMNDNHNHHNNNNHIQIKQIKTKEVTTTTVTENESKEAVRKTVTTKESTTNEITIPAQLLWSPFVQGLRFDKAEDQGNREHMENSTNIVNMLEQNGPSSQRKYIFTVMDGHLGDAAAKFCSENLPQYLAQFIDEIDSDYDFLNDSDNITDDPIVDAMCKAFSVTDEKFKDYAYDHQCEAGAVGAIIYYQYDAKSNRDHYIHIANVGDVRAVLCSNGTAKQLTQDHNTSNQAEKQRCCQFIGEKSDLLCGQISVTRAFGDYFKIEEEMNDDEVYHHKKLDGLICVPFIMKHKIDIKNDEFVIIACDGLWDVVSNNTAISVCRQSLRRDGDCKKAAQKLLNYAKQISCNQSMGKQEGPGTTCDNISVMVIGFANRDKDGNEHIGPQKKQMVGSRLGRRRRGFGFKSKTTNDK